MLDARLAFTPTSNASFATGNSTSLSVIGCPSHRADLYRLRQGVDRPCPTMYRTCIHTTIRIRVFMVPTTILRRPAPSLLLHTQWRTRVSSLQRLLHHPALQDQLSLTRLALMRTPVFPLRKMYTRRYLTLNVSGDQTLFS